MDGMTEKRRKRSGSIKQLGKELLADFAGSLFIAVGVYNFALYAEFPMTGFAGISIILYRLCGMSIGCSTILLNIPVALVCYRLLGKSFFLKSLKSMLISSVVIDYIAPLLPVYSGDKLLAAVCTGVFAGIGYAIIYLSDSSTGGLDFIIMAVKARKPHISLGRIAFAADAAVILFGGVIFRDMNGVIYGMIVSYLMAAVVDKMMYGMDAGKLALVVTARGDAIVDVIEACCGRGSTMLRAAGGYSKEEKQVVMCACNNKQMHLVQQAVKAADREAFLIILESNEVYGEGFKEVQQPL